MKFTAIIEHWLTTDPKLHHYRIVRRSNDWVICDCIDHAWADYPDFLIRENCVDVVTSWGCEHIPAADPNFFSRIHKHLVQLCKEANDNIS